MEQDYNQDVVYQPESILISNRELFFRAITNCGYKPMIFLIDLDKWHKHLVEEGTDKDITRITSRRDIKIITRYKVKVTEILNAMFRLNRDRKNERIIKILYDSLNTIGVRSFISAYKRAIMSIYSEECQNFQNIYSELLRADGNRYRINYNFFHGSFYHQKDGYNPSLNTINAYIGAVISFDIRGIRNFEEKFQQTKVAPRRKFKNLFMHEVEPMLLIDDYRYKYTKVYSLDIMYPKRWLLVGASGCGKTKTAETLYEIYAPTHKILCLNDRQGEMLYTKQSSTDVVELQKYGKIAKSFDVEIFSLPPFAEEARKSERQNVDKIIHINPARLSLVGWTALLDLNHNQESAFQRVLNQFTNHRVRESNELLEAIGSAQIHSATKNTISMRLENLIHQDIFDSNSNDIDQILRSKAISVFDTSLLFSTSLVRGTIAMFVQNVSHYSRHKLQERPFLLAFEELQAVLQNINNTQFEVAMGELFRRLRASGVSVITVQQNLNDLPQEFLANISDFVYMRNTDGTQIEKIKKSLGYDKSLFTDCLNSLRNEHALYIDSTGTVRIGKVVPSSAGHKYPTKR